MGLETSIRDSLFDQTFPNTSSPHPTSMALMKSGAARTPVPNPATSHVFRPYPLTP